MTPTLRDAAQQALEALEAVEFHAKRRTPDASIEVAVQPAITALRTALAEQVDDARCLESLEAFDDAPEPAIPPGYKLVPEVPTSEWINTLARHWIS